MLSFSSITPEKIAAYKSTDYCVGQAATDFNLRIGIPSEGLKRIYHATDQNSAIFITAFNPYGIEQEATHYITSQQKLGDYLRIISSNVIESPGSDSAGRRPPEPSFLGLGIDLPTSHLLGKHFDQDAVVWAGADTIPQLILLR